MTETAADDLRADMEPRWQEAKQLLKEAGYAKSIDDLYTVIEQVDKAKQILLGLHFDQERLDEED